MTMRTPLFSGRWLIALTLPALLGTGAVARSESTGLTAEQRERARAIRERTRDAARPQLEALRGAVRELRDLTRTEGSDPAAVGLATLKVARLRKEIARMRAESRREFEALLTDEQKQQLKAARERRGERAERRDRRHDQRRNRREELLDDTRVERRERDGDPR